MLFSSTKTPIYSSLWILCGLFAVVEGRRTPFEQLKVALIDVMGSDQYKNFNKKKIDFELLRDELQQQGKNVKINKRSDSEESVLLFVIEYLKNNVKDGVLPDLIKWLSSLAQNEGEELDLNIAQHGFDVMYHVTTSYNPIPLLQELCSINKKNKKKIDVNRLDPHSKSSLEKILRREDLIVSQKIACSRILRQIAKDNNQKIDEERKDIIEGILNKDTKIDENQRKRLIDVIYADETDGVNANKVENEVDKLKEEIVELEKESRSLLYKNQTLTNENKESKQKIKEAQKKLTLQLQEKEREAKTLRASLEETHNKSDKISQQLKDIKPQILEAQNIAFISNENYKTAAEELQRVQEKYEVNRQQQKKKKIIAGSVVLIIFILSHLFSNSKSLKNFFKKSK